MSEVRLVEVPLLNETLVSPPPARVRALKRHLVQSLRDLRSAKQPARLIQQTPPEPVGFAASVVAAACATCLGHCCKGGGDHAYIDERTMARVRRDHPDLDAGAVIAMYLARVAPLSYRQSCLFHSPQGCTLERSLRSELCNRYYCNGLRDFLRSPQSPGSVQIVAARNGDERRSPVMAPDAEGP